VAHKHASKKQKTKLAIITLAILSAVSYCSWPLGYIFNLPVSRRGLASELEALGQPYSWLFILLDVVSGVLIVALTYYLWRLRSRKHNRWLSIVLLNYAAFGVFTAIDSLLPMNCIPSLTVCPNALHNPMLLLHGIASITASVCLFVSVVMVWYRHRTEERYILMSMVLLAWAIFGIVSIIFLLVPGPGYLAQHYYITLCSFWVVLLPFAIQGQLKLRPAYAYARSRVREH